MAATFCLAGKHSCHLAGAVRVRALLLESKRQFWLSTRSVAECRLALVQTFAFVFLYGHATDARLIFVKRDTRDDLGIEDAH